MFVIPGLIAVGPEPSVFALLAVGLMLSFVASGTLAQVRLYEHGLVLRSIPGVRVLVIPHYGIDPDSLEAGGRLKLEDGLSAGAEGNIHHFPCGGTVRLTALHPRIAKRLATGEIDWNDAGERTHVRNGLAPSLMAKWIISYRDAEQHKEQLLDTIRRSQATRRAYRPTDEPPDAPGWSAIIKGA